MNEYIINEKTKNIETQKIIYRMGWKFDNKNNIINYYKNKIYNNNCIKKKYNIYEHFPHYFPEISDQGNMDTCVPNCISTIYYFNTMKHNNYLNFRISRLYMYYNVRKLYREIYDDCGSTIYDCLKLLYDKGVPPEFLHPYHEKFLYKKPNDTAYNTAKFCKLLNFKKLDKCEVKYNILNNNPVICGIKIFSNFNNNDTIKTGQINMVTDDEYLLGGHSIIIVGYDDDKKNYIFLNSWGVSWGNKGFGYLPYEYIEHPDYSDEFYVLTQITNPKINFYDNHKCTFDNVYILLNILFMSLLYIMKSI